nr:hypothetical protein [Pyrinomonadaceae bacterium]
PQPGNEGTYLLVNKTLIEAAGVIVLLAFNTGAIAGLDLLLTNQTRRRVMRSSGEVALQTPATSRVES